MEYQISENTRRCAATDRPLEPGEKIFSVLLDEDARLVRKDFCREAWQGPPEGAFSFWMGKVPTANEKRKLRIDDELLVECFNRLEGETDANKVNFRYVVALLLLRRKRFKFEESRRQDDHEVLSLLCTKTRTKVEVVNPRLTEEEMAAVQEEVFKVLGWE